MSSPSEVCGDEDQREDGIGAFAVAGGDPSEVLEPSEHALDEVSASVGDGIIGVGMLAGGLGGLTASHRARPASRGTCGRHKHDRQSTGEASAILLRIAAAPTRSCVCQAERIKARGRPADRKWRELVVRPPRDRPMACTKIPPAASAAERCAWTCVESTAVAADSPARPAQGGEDVLPHPLFAPSVEAVADRRIGAVSAGQSRYHAPVLSM